MSRLRPLAGLALCASTLATACSGQVVADADASTSTTTPIFGVERVVRLGAAPTTSAAAWARVVRVQRGADEALAAELVGAVAPAPARGTCAADAAVASSIALATISPIDLLDVGAVAVVAGAARVPLAARVFPDVVDLVSGVVYTSRDRAADGLPEGTPYAFSASGGASFGAIDVVAEAPLAPANVALDGVPLADDTSVAPATEWALSWDVADADAGDVVWVELRAEGSVSRTRCAFDDTGKGIVPAGAVPPGAGFTLAVHRRRTLAARTSSGADAEIAFDFAVEGRLRAAATPER